MIAKLPEWYRVLSLTNMNEEILEKRSKTIKKIVKTKDINLLFDCVKYFLNKPITNSNFVSDLTQIFLEDPMFPQTNNELELRVLTGAIIVECLETSKTVERIQIALAVRTGLFQKDNTDLINVDIISTVESFLMKESESRRALIDDVTIPDFSVKINLADTGIESINGGFEEMNDGLSEIKKTMKAVLDFSKKNISILQEESNIHWWIFRAFSNLVGKQIKELDQRTVPVLIGKELCNLTSFAPGPINSDQFLKKILFDNVKNKSLESTLKESINTIDLEVKKIFSIQTTSAIGVLCPIHLACSLSLQVDGDENAWLPLFEKATQIKSNIKLDAAALAIQVYNESLLIQSTLN